MSRFSLIKPAYQCVERLGPADGGVLNYLVELPNLKPVSTILKDVLTSNIDHNLLEKIPIDKIGGREELDRILAAPRLVLFSIVMLVILIAVMLTLMLVLFISCPTRPVYRLVHIVNALIEKALCTIFRTENKNARCRQAKCLVVILLIIGYASIFVIVPVSYQTLIQATKQRNIVTQTPTSVPLIAPGSDSAGFKNYSYLEGQNSEPFYEQLALDFHHIQTGSLIQAYELSLSDLRSFLAESINAIPHIFSDALGQSDEDLPKFLQANLEKTILNLLNATGFNELRNSMREIQKTCSQTKNALSDQAAMDASVTKLKNSMDSINTKLKNMQNNIFLFCQLSNSNCNDFQFTQSQGPVIDVDTNKLHFPPSAVTNSYRKLQDSISNPLAQVMTQFDEVDEILESMKFKLDESKLNDKNKQKRLEKYLEDIHAQLLKTLSKFPSPDSFSKYAKIATLWLPSIWLGLCVIIGLCTMYVVISWMIILRKPASKIYGKYDPKYKRKFKCPFIFIASILPILLFVFVINIALYFAVSIAILDVCRYTNARYGNIMDQFLIELLAKTVFNEKGKESLSDEVNSILHVKTPSNILEGLYKNCAPENYLPGGRRMGMLPALGINSLIQLNLVEYFPGFSAEFDNNTNKIGQLFKPLLAEGGILSKDFKKDYELIYVQTDKFANDEVISAFEAQMHKFDPEIEKIDRYIKKISNLMEFNSKHQTQSDLESIDSLMKGLKQEKEEVMAKLSGITDNRNITNLLRELLSKLEQIDALLKGDQDSVNRLVKAFREAVENLVISLTEKFQPGIDGFFKKTIPCSRLNRAFRGLIASLCDTKAGLLARMLGFFFWVLIFLFFSFMYLIVSGFSIPR